MIALGVHKPGARGPVAALNLLKDIVGKNVADAKKRGLNTHGMRISAALPKPTN
tara:strand:- start:329 stop:490 length:162 start_codon:yes stop_codon:yes gene_type:complete